MALVPFAGREAVWFCCVCMWGESLSMREGGLPCQKEGKAGERRNVG